MINIEPFTIIFEFFSKILLKKIILKQEIRDKATITANNKKPIIPQLTKLYKYALETGLFIKYLSA